MLLVWVSNKAISLGFAAVSASELLLRPALELAGLIRSGELSSRELVQTSLRRIDELEPHIRAFTHVAHESALAAADEITAGDPRPFAGVPIAIKDNRAVAGMPLTMCSDLFGDLVVPHDSFLVRRLREAGFVIVGKTALPEMGILPTTESRRFGPTHNPWGLDRTPGGSSGGSAAAVAAGMVPIAHGNDGGGSIRIPAACCGLIGLKAARGRVSVGPESGDSFLVTDGVLTRDVADTVAAIDVLAGYEPGDSTWAPPPPASYAALAGAETDPPTPLRIGLALNLPLEGSVLDPVCEAAARDAATLLESLGHAVEEVEPPWSDLDLLPDFTNAFGPQISMVTMIGGQLAGRDLVPDDVEALTWEMWQLSRELNSVTMLSSLMRLQSVARSVVAFLTGFDAVLTPALAQRPLRIGEVHGQGPDPWDHYQRSGYFTPYTAVLNVTGQPAISVPLYQGKDGLPTAVQLIGPPAREETLLQLAAQLETALPWADRRPVLPV
jgi:amidase